MAEELLGKFRCVVVTPRATLLDCKTHSVTLEAQDGQIGVLRNHMPMLCRLGMGIMQVRDFVTDTEQTPSNVSFLVDGGFARVSNNVLTVLAYDVTTGAEAEPGKAEKLRQEAGKLTGGDAQSMQRRQHDMRKASLLEQLSTRVKDKQGAAS